ncbi:Abi-alpha family protein [Flavobacterium sp. HTF]|uniref:Abi-alpha family protein n=1 Tax=Flavobacterium sp. HTF TaxID=2170732 RepID=UPI000D5E2971|nr:Abi-alpha family protein [Flavobacterium sp. HTF]PWB25426.1 hypothetical protein DCO46_08695 [Flavobacterium sp. HTF]
MGNLKFDVTSTAIEKGIDLVAGFIEKLAGSSLEEAGLLLADKIRIRRLKNQIKIFSDAKKIAEESSITLKQVNLKTLVPLLELSSLEEDETLQEKWANLIVNFSDASKNYESSVFPFILSQLSRQEVIELEAIYEKKKWHSFTKPLLPAIHRANFNRLGLTDSLIYTSQNKDSDDLVFDTFTGGVKITALGKEFVECCRSKSNSAGNHQ